MLLQYFIEREAADFLARREFLKCGDVFRDIFLRRHQKESAVSPPVGVVCGDLVGFLEWIRAQVEDLGHAEGNEGFLPDSDIIRVTP